MADTGCVTGALERMSKPPDTEPIQSRPQRGRRQVFNSVSTRIIFFVFLSTFLSALVVSWISIHSIHSYLRGEIEKRFPAMLEDRHAAMESLIEVTAAEFEGAMRDTRLNAVLTSARPSPGAADSILSERLEFMPDFTGLLLLDAGRVPFGRAGLFPALAHQETIVAIAAEVMNEGMRHHAFRDRQGHLRGLLIAPLKSDQAIVGFISATYDFARFEQLLTPATHDGSARISLVAADGMILAHAADEMRERITPARIAQHLDGRVHEYTASDRSHVLGAGRALPRWRWLLLVEEPFEIAFAPVLSVVSRIFISDLFIILLFSFLAYKITSAVMAPIQALSDGAKRISEGDLDHQIGDARAQDEIGLLIRTFNDMVRQLRRSQLEIEDDQQRLTEQNEELHRANEVLAQLSITDGLTKLHNHRYFQDHLTREIKRISRTGEPLSMILMDLDDFKRLNDLYGHAAGDEILLGVANTLNESVRETDLLARYGGEEFVILATGTDLDGAISLAEKIRLALDRSSHIVDDSMRPVRVTVSMGVAVFEGDRREFFRSADRALYQAKAQGKNCVIAADRTESTDSP